MIPTKRNLYYMMLDEVFYPVNWDELEKCPDRAQRHCMDASSTEILGQFMDCYPIDNEKLKRILVLGLLEEWRING